MSAIVMTDVAVNLGNPMLRRFHLLLLCAQVQDYVIRNEVDLRRADVEISLGESLDHNNIVKTVAHAAHMLLDCDQEVLSSQVRKYKRCPVF